MTLSMAQKSKTKKSQVRKIKAYVDTSAFIAFLDGSDSHHSLFLRLFSESPPLITSSLVITEGHGWFLKRYDRLKALQFLSFIEDLNVLTIISVGEDELSAATRLLRKYSDQDLTQVDAVGLYLLKRDGINNCWSTDFHLGLTGAPLVIHQH